MQPTLLLAAAALAAISSAADASASSLNTNATRRLLDTNMYRMRGVDLVGNDFATAQAPYLGYCVDNCRLRAFEFGLLLRADVTRTSYNGGTCWCKKVGSAIPATTLNADADSVFMANRQDEVLWFTTRGDVDMPGNDLTSTTGIDMSVCRTECVRNNQCHAVVWTNYNGGTCWLKSRASAYVPKAGASAVFLARKILSSSSA